MTREKLLHLSAVASILGGGLRIVDAFLNNAHGYVQVAYFVTDVMLIFGLYGIYLSHSNRLGLTGLIGFAAITGLLMIVRSFGQKVYLVGATVTVLGMVVLSIVMLVSRWLGRGQAPYSLGSAYRLLPVSSGSASIAEP